MDALMTTVRQPDNSLGDELTCLTSGSCVFLAWANNSAGSVVAATLTGTSWSAMPTFPGSPGVTGYQISSLACSSIENCYAGATLMTHHAGATRTCTRSIKERHRTLRIKFRCGGGSLEETTELLVWNGSTWSVSTALPPSAVGSPTGAGCDPQGHCYLANGQGFGQLIELLQGAGATSAYRTQDQASLIQIVCPSSAYCIASSESGYNSHYPQRQMYLTLRNGKWSDRYAQLVGDTTSSELIGLSCIAPGNCYQLDMPTAEASFATTATDILHFGP
jgi:hypothetical protein